MRRRAPAVGDRLDAVARRERDDPGARGAQLGVERSARRVGDIAARILRLELVVDEGVERVLVAQILEEVLLALALEHPVRDLDYVHLSVGGTLSVGGIGGTSQHAGVQVDNAAELEVVTGCGERVRCSHEVHRDLFEGVFAGAGQCAIIVRAKLRLVPAETQPRLFLLFYDDLEAYVADQLQLLRDGRFSYLEGQVVRRADDTAGAS